MLETFVTIHFRDGSLPTVVPVQNLENMVRVLGDKIERVENPLTAAIPNRPVVAPVVTDPNKAPKEIVEKDIKVTKESLLGKLLKDNKITAAELIKWIDGSESVEDIMIATEGDTRKTVKDAKKERISELL